MIKPDWIAVDWGTSNLRVWAMDASGVLAEAASDRGMASLQRVQFEGALLELIEPWLLPGHVTTVIAAGMVGARQGWIEAPYAKVPTVPLQRGLMVSPRGDLRIHVHICHGLSQAKPADVMRGEETQIWGAALPDGHGCVLPGTHSKWAWLGSAGEISRFCTYMTGELYGLLTRHGILGRLMQFDDAPAALRREEFARGVQLGLAGHTQLSHTIFAARTAGLMGQVAPAGLPDYLSGILVGAEIGAATQGGAPSGPITLIGDDDLCLRYEIALQIRGLASARAPAGTTTSGQWKLAMAAGLIRPAP